MSSSSKKSSSVEEDLRAMLACDESLEEDNQSGFNKEDMLKRAQDWKIIPPDLVNIYTKPRKSGKCQKRAPNVWGFAKGDCLRHQTDKAPCRCGIGKGFSFFLENIDNKEFVRNIESSSFHADPKKPRNPARNIATLVPNELHVKRYQRTGHLELLQDENTITAEDHSIHQTCVPNRVPVTREDVLHLKDVFRRLLSEAGVGEKLSDIVMEKRTNSEIENLIELVRSEQEVYNIVFHEIIRQVTIDCTERGEILAELREFYARILDRMPHIFMSIHQENIVQRSLDRRLMEELLHFKIRLVQVVLGLDNVHHVYQIEKARLCTAQEELKHALIEAQKTSQISDQLHALYKMQKKRRELEMDSYAKQREFWKNATCAMISKVINEYKLGLFRFMATSLDTWVQFAHKIMEERESKDNEQVELNFSFIKDWVGKVEDTISYMNIREQRVYKFANSMWHSIDAVANQLVAAVNADPTEFQVTPFEGAKKVTLHKAIVQWASQFTIDLNQIDDGITGSQKAEKYIGRLEGLREAFRFQTECHILVAIRDENFNTNVGKVFSQLTAMMATAYPLLEEAFFQGVDPIIHTTEVDISMWAKRNILVGDLQHLQHELAQWSMNLQQACDASGYMMWEGKKTTFDVVREKLTLKTAEYRGQVIQCLTESMHTQKLDLSNIQDKVTQWVVQCIVLAVPFHPSLPNEACQLIEGTVSDVDELGRQQQSLARQLQNTTDFTDRSWQLVQEQGGRTYGSVGIDPEMLSSMFRAECNSWCELSATCIKKLRNKEMFEPDVHTRDVGVVTDAKAPVRDQETNTEVFTKYQANQDWSSMSMEVNANSRSSLTLTVHQDDSVVSSAHSMSAPVPPLMLQPANADESLLLQVEGIQNQLIPLASPSETARDKISGDSQDRSCVDTTLGEGNRVSAKRASFSRFKASSSKTASQSRMTLSSLSHRSSKSKASNQSGSKLSQISARRLSPHAKASARSGGSLTSGSRQSSSVTRGRPGSLLSPSQMSRPPGRSASGKPRAGRSVYDARCRSASVRSKSRSRRQMSRSLRSSHPTVELQTPATPTARPPTQDASSTADLPAAPVHERAAQTVLAGHLHVIKFPDFMIEMFAREMKTSNTGQMVVVTDEERERMTALQLNIEQVELLHQRVADREQHGQDLHEKLETARDEIRQLQHLLRVANVKLQSAEGKLSRQVTSDVAVHTTPSAPANLTSNRANVVSTTIGTSGVGNANSTRPIDLVSGTDAVHNTSSMNISHIVNSTDVVRSTSSTESISYQQRKRR